MIYHHVSDGPGLRRFAMGKERYRFYLHYARQGAVTFAYPGVIEQLIPEEHFQVCFVAFDSQAVEFKSGGKSSLLSISFPDGWLDQLGHRFQVMSSFLEKARAGTPSILFKNPQPLTAENKRLLNDIFLDTWSEDHIKYMVRLILLPALKTGDRGTHILENPDSTPDNVVFAVAEWLLLHPDEPASISFLAQKFLVNEFKLKSDFKKQFGVPVITFQRKARVEKAKQMLRQPLSIAAIAKATGFVHTTYFSDFFRRETGVSPSDYRKVTSVNETVFSNNRE